MQSILVCDDDKQIVEAIDIYLTGEGFEVIKAYDGAEALELLKTHTVNLMILDVMMPGLDGIRTTLKVRETSSIPIIILSAKSEDADKILGLNIGADDYITKPFNPLELVARVKSQLRRYTQLGNMNNQMGNHVFKCGGLQINDENKEVTVDGELIKLTPIEYNILLLSGFTMAITNCTVQIMCNATLQVYGGDLYVGVMTIINSIREIATLPVTGVTHSAQPVLGFNYGAKEYGRVKKAIVFTSFIAILYTTGIWLIVDGFPAFFIRIFNQDAELITAGIPAIRLYFFGFFMMSLQFSGQSIFVGLGKSKKAIFFSIFRKVIIVVPLTILLPGMFGMGTNGVFAAEPISNFIGGIACFGTMLLTIWRELTRLQKGKDS